jgi:hypothetical protein
MTEAQELSQNVRTRYMGHLFQARSTLLLTQWRRHHHRRRCFRARGVAGLSFGRRSWVHQNHGDESGGEGIQDEASRRLHQELPKAEARIARQYHVLLSFHLPLLYIISSIESKHCRRKAEMTVIEGIFLQRRFCEITFGVDVGLMLILRAFIFR